MTPEEKHAVRMSTIRDVVIGIAVLALILYAGFRIQGCRKFDAAHYWVRVSCTNCRAEVRKGWGTDPINRVKNTFYIQSPKRVVMTSNTECPHCGLRDTLRVWAPGNGQTEETP